jgi:hypothetical protein
MKRAVYILTSLLQFIIVNFCVAQTPLEFVKNKTEEYGKTVLQEKIYAHTDKEFYLSGEIIWLKLYCVEANSNKLIDQSKVGYIELLDKNNVMVLHAKIELDSGKGNGSLVLSNSVHSGVYKLVAYTNWMKNFGAERFFEKQITIVNTFRKPEWKSLIKPDTLSIHFYPEGGNLIAGVNNTVAFQLSDQYGQPVDGTGYLIKNARDTILSFAPKQFDLGSFEFTPESTSNYKVIVTNNNRTIQTALPEIYGSGYALHAAATDNRQVKITVSTNEVNETELYLFIQHNDSIEKALILPIKNRVAEYKLDLNECKEGISRITVFDKRRNPVCERLIWKPYSHMDPLKLYTDKSKYSLRSNVQLQLKIPGNEADLSLSVFQVDSLQKAPEISIMNYLLLNSELNGTIYNPDYYFQHQENNEAIELLLLTHGWTRFKWNDVLSVPKGFSFVPEYEGLDVVGSIQSSLNTINNRLINLSVPSSKFIFTNSIISDSGQIHFVMDKLYGINEMIVQPGNLSDSIYKLNFHNPYSEQFTQKEITAFGLSEQWKDLLVKHHINVQVQNNFWGALPVKYSSSISDSTLFYSTPDASYLLDDYTRFPTMEEVMREFVNKVRVRKTGSVFHYQVVNTPYKDYFDSDPLVLLDGVPVSVNRIIEMDPLKVKRIDVIARKYFYRNAVYNGIVSYLTYTGDLSGYELDPHSVVVEYEGLQLRREFYSPDYSNASIKNARQADRRNVLLWNADIKATQQNNKINFYTSDVTGIFLIRVEGIDKEGHPLVADKIIEVNDQH